MCSMTSRISFRKPARRPAGALSRRSAIVVALIAAVGALAWFVARESADPRFGLRSIEVSGNQRTSQQAILAAAALPLGSNIWLVDPSQPTQRVRRLPWVRSAAIRRSWPNHMTITVVERTPVARLRLPGLAEDPSVGPDYAIVDADLRVLSVERLSPDNEGLVVFGIARFGQSSVQPGASISDSWAMFARTAYQAMRSRHVRCTEIDVDPVMGASIVTDHDVRVVFGTLNDLDKKVELLRTILARMPQTANVKYIDLRSASAPTVLYR
jgi:cell division protein FtsQ